MLLYEKGFVRPPPPCSADWDRVRWTRAWRTYEMAGASRTRPMGCRAGIPGGVSRANPPPLRFP